MMRSNLSMQRLTKLGLALAQGATGQLTELLRVLLASGQRLQDGASGHTHHVGQHTSQLEIAVLQQLVDAQGVLGG